MAHPLLTDPWVAAKIDKAVARHGKNWSKEQVEAFREQMAWTLATHPKAARLLELAQPGIIARTGTRTIGGELEPDDAADDAEGKSEPGKR